MCFEMHEPMTRHRWEAGHLLRQPHTKQLSSSR